MKAATLKHRTGRRCSAFQSTPPVKAATAADLLNVVNEVLFQSTPPVKAATLITYLHFNINDISIHAAREGGDKLAFIKSSILTISIHAAREGGDYNEKMFFKVVSHFNPRRP